MPFLERMPCISWLEWRLGDSLGISE